MLQSEHEWTKREVVFGVTHVRYSSECNEI